jgi:hypothetical protein
VTSTDGSRSVSAVRDYLIERLDRALLYPGMYGGELTLQMLLDDLAWIDRRESRLGSVTGTLAQTGAWSQTAVRRILRRLVRRETSPRTPPDLGKRRGASETRTRGPLLANNRHPSPSVRPRRSPSLRVRRDALRSRPVAVLSCCTPQGQGTAARHGRPPSASQRCATVSAALTRLTLFT